MGWDYIFLFFFLQIMRAALKAVLVWPVILKIDGEKKQKLQKHQRPTIAKTPEITVNTKQTHSIWPITPKTLKIDNNTKKG